MNGKQDVVFNQPAESIQTDVEEKKTAPTLVCFGSRGWTVIAFQAILFWIAAGAVTHGLNVMLPALSKAYHLDYNALLALATPAPGP